MIRSIIGWSGAFIGAASVIIGYLVGSPGIPATTLVLIGFALALFVLMPAINRARDRALGGDAAAESRFKTLHFASVVLNAVQLCVLAYVSSLLLS